MTRPVQTRDVRLWLRYVHLQLRDVRLQLRDVRLWEEFLLNHPPFKTFFRNGEKATRTTGLVGSSATTHAAAHASVELGLVGGMRS